MMKIQTSREYYLKALLVLEKRGGYIRSVDLARYQNVSKPSVSHAVALLKEEGYITVDDDFFLHLTETGREIAEKVYERHCFFTKHLMEAGVDKDVAAREACLMEHVISDQSFEKLKEKLDSDK